MYINVHVDDDDARGSGRKIKGRRNGIAEV